MNFSYEELARLNQMISISLMSGEIDFDEVSKSIHQKVTAEISKRIIRNRIREESEVDG